jgi:hypothetical protein
MENVDLKKTDGNSDCENEQLKRTYIIYGAKILSRFKGTVSRKS